MLEILYSRVPSARKSVNILLPQFSTFFYIETAQLVKTRNGNIWNLKGKFHSRHEFWEKVLSQHEILKLHRYGF